MLADVNRQITEKIIASLERGEIPWKKPWVAGFPRNILTGRPYNGINVFLLWNSRFASNWWGTEKQIQKLHGRLKPDAEPHFVFFAGWKNRLLANNISGERIKTTFGFTKLYRVFNADQCEGLALPQPEGKSEDYARAEAIVNGYQHCRILTTRIRRLITPGMMSYTCRPETALPHSRNTTLPFSMKWHIRPGTRKDLTGPVFRMP